MITRLLLAPSTLLLRSVIAFVLCCSLSAAILLTGTTFAQAPKQLPRVLIIGDSISMGYTEPARNQLEGTAEVFRPKENCQHTAYGLARIDIWLGKEKWDVIHFNWGIWDTHMLDAKGGLIRNEAAFTGEMHIRHTPEKYREHLLKLVDKLEKTKAKLIWANTTPIMSRTGKRFDDVKALNAVAQEVMRDRKITVNDLYEYTLPHIKEWQSADRVHFNAVGNDNLAKRVGESIRAALKAKPGDGDCGTSP